MNRFNRLVHIRSLRWSHGSVLPEKERLNATEAELGFFRKYNKSLATYMTSVGLDLTVDHWSPKNTKMRVPMIIIIIFDDKLVQKLRMYI